jgi:hypothetical protein
MSIEAHIHSLKIQHQQLEDAIREAHIHHRSTVELKKKKLHVKDEIKSLEERLSQHSDLKNAA